MITKHDLKNFRNLKMKIRILKEQIEDLSCSLCSPGSVKITGMPIAHSDDPDKFGNTVALIEKLTAVYKAKLNLCLEQQEKIETAVATLRDDEQNLIKMYYFQGLTWEEVCCYINYSWTTLHRKHKQILNKLKSV